MVSDRTNKTIIPRFEFRIFGHDLAFLNEEIKTIPNIRFFTGDPIRSSEYYLLSKTSDTTNCKIRNNTIDIKTLVNEEDGCEKWTVLLKAEFPLRRRQIAEEVFPVLSTQSALLKDAFYDLNEFVDIVTEYTDIQVLSVDKIRYRYNMDNTFYEFARVNVKGTEVHTFAVESEDKNAVLDSINRLDISSRENLNYQKALKRIIGWEGIK